MTHNSRSIAAKDDQIATVTAKFWITPEADMGDMEAMVSGYVTELNAALARSKIPIIYQQLGSVQQLPISGAKLDANHFMHTFLEEQYVRTGKSISEKPLPKTMAELDALQEGLSKFISLEDLPRTDAEIKRNYRNFHRNKVFLNALGDSDDGRRRMKQSADHMVMIIASFQFSFECLIFRKEREVFATLSVCPDCVDTFVHEAGHCLGAFHDRYTSHKVDDAGDDYNYGFCLPNSPYATVMSYPQHCPSPRRKIILHFSNPEVKYNEIPTGDKRNNNAKYMKKLRFVYSQIGDESFQCNTWCLFDCQCEGKCDKCSWWSFQCSYSGRDAP